MKTLPPARWHSTNTCVSSLGILGTEPDYFPTQQPLLQNSKLNKRHLNKTLPGAITQTMSNACTKKMSATGWLMCEEGLRTAHFVLIST